MTAYEFIIVMTVLLSSITVCAIAGWKLVTEDFILASLVWPVLIVPMVGILPCALVLDWAS